MAAMQAQGAAFTSMSEAPVASSAQGMPPLTAAWPYKVEQDLGEFLFLSPEGMTRPLWSCDKECSIKPSEQA